MTNYMTEKELHEFIKKNFPEEDTDCDWKEMKNLKNSFNGHEGDDVMSYVSAIANMEGGHLIIGVKDKTLDIVGTDLSNFNLTSDTAVLKIKENCTNISSEGLSIDEYTTSDTNKTVWIINIPKHLPRKPVYAHKKAWQRIKSSLVVLTPEREAAILNEEIHHIDWSAHIVDGAGIEDLNPDAIAVALSGFCQRYPDKAEEAKKWDVATFLDKARLTINRQITKTALLLVGKEESAHYLNHIAQMVWRLRTDNEKAGEIFAPPFLLSTSRLMEKIRNYRIKIFPNNSLIPAEIWKYDTKTILEALHNCIAHQDYSCNERIIVTEEQDRLTFENAGFFYDGSYEDYIEGKKTPKSYRNTFLVQAMVNLKMIDTQGYGIHEMYSRQKERFLPMPDYDVTDKMHVKLIVPGQVINQEYSLLLMENADLDLGTTVLLDNLQKGKQISDNAISLLRKLKLIEGRKPNIHISKKVAQASHQEVQYTDMKGFDDQYYKDLIIKALKEHKCLKRSDMDNLLINKLPGVLNEGQKKNKIDNLLRWLRSNEIIYADEHRSWHLVER